MSWVRIDDQAWDHPKHVAAGPMAFALWVWGLLYCSRHTTDGLVPADAPLRCGVPKAEREVTRLVVAGLWDEVEGGYCIHDYHEYNPSKSQVIKRKEAAAKRLADWRKRKGYAHGNADETPLHDGFESVGNSCPVPVPVPVPVPQEPKTRTRGADAPGFDAFWSAYPRKDARKDALKAWNALRPDDALQCRMVAAIRTQSSSEQWRKGKTFIPLPASWLRGERWNDEGGAPAAMARSTAAPMPAYEPDWCQHEPRCASRDWHDVLVSREREEVATT